MSTPVSTQSKNDLPKRRLIDCGRLLSGGTPSKARPEFWEGDIPWFSSKELRSFELTETEHGVTEEGALEGATLVPPGTVLFVIRGMSLANEFRVGVTKQRSTFNQDVKGLVPGPDVDSRYLARCLQSLGPKVVDSAETSSHGTKRLPSHLFENLEIPVPSLAAQRRIADILDRADAIRRKRKQALALTDALLRSTFLEMFGDPITNPKGWPTCRVGDICSLHAGNSLPPGEPFDGQLGGILLLKVGDMNLRGNEEDIVTSREWTCEAARSIVAPAGSIVFPKRGGAIATNKKRALTRPCALDPNLMALTPNECLSFAYFAQWMNLLDLSTLSNGSTIPQINKADLEPLRIQVPAPAIQAAYGERAGLIRRMHQRSRRALQDSVTLFAGLSMKAFQASPYAAPEE